ncbi:MAG: hypothetical protein WC955_06995 [Elusimicrobiota bacterium]
MTTTMTMNANTRKTGTHGLALAIKSAGILLLLISGCILLLAQSQRTAYLTYAINQRAANGIAYGKTFSVQAETLLTARNDLALTELMQTAVFSNPAVAYSLVVDNKGKILAHNDVSQWGKVYNNKLTSKALATNTPVVQPYTYRRNTYYDLAFPLFTKLNDTKTDTRAATLRIGIKTEDILPRINSITARAVLQTLPITFILFILTTYLYYMIYTQPLITLAAYSLTKEPNERINRRFQKILAGKNLFSVLARETDKLTRTALAKTLTKSAAAGIDDTAYLLHTAQARIFSAEYALTDGFNRITFSSLRLSTQLPNVTLLGKHLLELDTYLPIPDWAKNVESAITTPGEIKEVQLTETSTLKILAVTSPENEIIGMIVSITSLPLRPSIFHPKV